MTVKGVVAIIRLRTEPVTDEIVDALAAGGIRAIEATLPTPGALGIVDRRRADPAVVLGVGTIRTSADVELAVAAGAQFLVTPTTVPAVLEATRAHGLSVCSGALTPTEIDRAWTAGAALVKVFPIDAVGGPGYLRAIAAPLDDIPLMPTGGVTVESAELYAALGCPAVGVGSALVSEQAVRDRDWAGITARARAFADAWDRGVAARG
jgi:2-dehydro-3-deoxyphosphogluconate aldolase/(4S)-4-hydroxy-2-oxoglutarate aldolase